MKLLAVSFGELRVIYPMKSNIIKIYWGSTVNFLEFCNSVAFRSDVRISIHAEDDVEVQTKVHKYFHDNLATILERDCDSQGLPDRKYFLGKQITYLSLSDWQ